MWKLLSQQQNFVAATSRTKSSQTELVLHTKQFGPPMCLATFCSNLSADLYTQSDLSLRPVAHMLPSVFPP